MLIPESNPCAPLIRQIHLLPQSVLIKERTAAKRFKAGETTVIRACRCGCALRSCLVASAITLRITFFIATANGSILDVLKDDDRSTLLFVRGLVFPGVLVQPTEDVHDGTILQFHLFDAIDDRAKAFYGIVEPSRITVCLRVIDLLADTEPHCQRLVGSCDTDGGFVVIPLGYDDLCCDYL